MTIINHLLVFSFLTAIINRSTIDANTLDEFVENEMPVKWTLGELGPQESIRIEEENVQNVCECFITYKFTDYCEGIRNFSRVIRDGNCQSSRAIRSFAMGDSSQFMAPPAFFENVICEDEHAIILISSGEQRKLTLKQASIFICPESIDTSLQELDITGVPKILIAPGAFKTRDTDLTIRFMNVKEKIIIPEKAFFVHIMIPESPSDHDQIGYEMESHPKIKFEVMQATKIEFMNTSVVAPLVKIKLSNINDIEFHPNAIVPYAFPEGSSLEIGHSQTVIMGSQTILAGKFEAKYIKQLLMKENAVEVRYDDGAGAKIEHVTNMTVLDEALSIASGADIIFNNITLTYAGIRSIQGVGHGNLRRATFTHVKATQIASVSMCIKTETAIVFDLVIGGKDDNNTGACIQGQQIHGSVEGGTVVCERSYDSRINICDDLKCSPCSPSIIDNESIPSSFPFTTNNLETSDHSLDIVEKTTESHIDDVIYTTQSSDVLLIETSTKHDSHRSSSPRLHEPKGKSENSFHSMFQEIKDTPIYIIVIFLCVVIIGIIFIIYIIYKCCTCKKHDKYYLPQENRLSTFRNPRTIMTSENLAEQSNTLKSRENEPPQVYTTFDSYRRPTAMYIATPERDDIDGSSQSSGNTKELPHGHYPSPTTTNDPNSSTQECPHQNLSPEESTQEFQEQNSTPGESMQEYQHQNLSPEECYLHPENEIPIDQSQCEGMSTQEYSPSNEFIQTAQVPDEDFSSSDESSLSGSRSPPPEYQEFPTDDQVEISHIVSPSQEHQLRDTRVPSNEDAAQLNRLSLYSKEMSDDEMII